MAWGRHSRMHAWLWCTHVHMMSAYVCMLFGTHAERINELVSGEVSHPHHQLAARWHLPRTLRTEPDSTQFSAMTRCSAGTIRIRATRVVHVVIVCCYDMDLMINSTHLCCSIGTLRSPCMCMIDRQQHGMPCVSVTYAYACVHGLCMMHACAGCLHWPMC